MLQMVLAFLGSTVVLSFKKRISSTLCLNGQENTLFKYPFPSPPQKKYEKHYDLTHRTRVLSELDLSYMSKREAIQLSVLRRCSRPTQLSLL